LSRYKSQDKIQHLVADLRRSFLSKLLKYFCAAKNTEKIRKIEYDLPLLNSVKEHLAESSDKTIPVIYVYNNLLRLIEGGKPEYYYDLKGYLFDNLGTFNTIEIRQFLNHMTNYCTRRIKKGEYEFIAEKHEIYQVGLELKCWSTGIIFSTHQFINIVRNALLMNKIEWVKEFVAQYKCQLHIKHKEDILNYGQALLHFHLREFDKAHLYLSSINSPEDFTYHLNFKVLLIKIYHEFCELSIDNADTHPINYELEAIRNHIVSTRNKKMSESLRQSYNNFIKIFKSILDRHKKLLYKQEVSVKNVDKLKEKLHNTSPIMERPWLEEKIEELMNKVS